ncbi:MAG TPA: hypothetical protein VFB96_00925 [Pirellulaceae bacterium]|nr:hypothetical protein [Pirellulaceae bacterium]
MTALSFDSLPSLRCCALVTAMLLLAGCGEGNHAMPAASNPEVARQALEKALGQWQAGQTADALATASPQIYVNDFDWRDGRKLKQFQVAGPAEDVGLQVRLPVALDVEHPSGQVVRSQVSYSISTSPVVSIVRDDP